MSCSQTRVGGPTRKSGVVQAFTSPSTASSTSPTSLKTRRHKFLNIANARGWLVAPRARLVAQEALAAWRAGLLPPVIAPPQHYGAFDSLVGSLERSLSLAAGVDDIEDGGDADCDVVDGDDTDNDVIDDGYVDDDAAHGSPAISASKLASNRSSQADEWDNCKDIDDNDETVEQVTEKIDDGNQSSHDDESDDWVDIKVSPSSHAELCESSDEDEADEDREVEEGMVDEEGSASEDIDNEDIIYVESSDDYYSDRDCTSDGASSASKHTWFGDVTDDETPPRTPVTPGPSLVRNSKYSSGQNSSSSVSQGQVSSENVLDTPSELNAPRSHESSSEGEEATSDEALSTSSRTPVTLCEVQTPGKDILDVNTTVKREILNESTFTPGRPREIQGFLGEPTDAASIIASGVGDLSLRTPNRTNEVVLVSGGEPESANSIIVDEVTDIPSRTPRHLREPQVFNDEPTSRRRGQSQTTGLMTPTTPRVVASTSKHCLLKGLAEWLGEGAFAQTRNAAADKLLRYFDREVLRGGVIHDESGCRRVTVGWNARLYKTAGVTYLRRKAESGDPIAAIELSIKVVDEPARLYNTLAHELCHAATWIVDRIAKPPHGDHFKAWASRFARWDSQLRITTCHEYAIRYKFNYECVACGLRYGRHSRSINTEKQVCGRCKGRLELLAAR